MTVRVVVGEDDFLVRQGVERALATQDDFEVVASCDRYDALREAVEQHLPDVIVTDIRMPPTMTDEGIRLAAALAASHPQLGVNVRCWRRWRVG